MSIKYEVPPHLAEECKKLENYKCQFCNYILHKENVIDFVNVIDIERFTRYNQKDENTKSFIGLDRLLVVCPNCEWQVDKGIIKFYDTGKRFILQKSAGKEQGVDRLDINIRSNHLSWALKSSEVSITSMLPNYVYKEIVNGEIVEP